ncbi:MAG: HAD-IIIA family hydrolase [Desulfobacteraceae bacterium]|nr:HAD-IIIA family hydrolase [Desulfobacteraceae bacterium]MCF8094822.1 HAD-IIIA family hydrolase [Desulfobacteraceae bacterium]
MLGNIRHAILDRDGVINEESPEGYILSPEEWIWIPGAKEALSMLAQAGIAISVATNQSCVGRGLIDEQGLYRINEKMKNQAAEQGVFFAGIYFCPHLPEYGCRCRKPAPGLLEKAIRQTGFERCETVFIGDAARDLLAAKTAGIASFLVRTGKGADTEADLQKGIVKEIDTKSVHVFDDLLSACRAITATKEKLAK